MKLNKSQVFRVTLLVVFFISLIICCGLLSACNNENLIRVYFYDEYGNLIKYGSGDYATKDKNEIKIEIENWNNYINAKIEKLILEGNGDSETNSVSASESIGADEQKIFAKYLEKYKNEGYINALGYKFEFYGKEELDKELDKKRPVYKVKLTKKAIKYDIEYSIDSNLLQDSSVIDNLPKDYTIENGNVSLTETELSVKDCYTFDGWYSDRAHNKGVSYIDRELINSLINELINKDSKTITLYGKVSPKEYTITYENLKGADNSINPTKYTVESENITFTAISTLGYDFKQWDIKSIQKGSTGDKTVTAIWSDPIKYSIKYIIDDINLLQDSSVIDNLPKKYTIENDDVSLTETKLSVKEGYIFDGWYSDEGRTEKCSKIAQGSTGNKTFYAKILSQKYTITIDGTPIEYEYNQQTKSPKDPTKLGYSFTGWTFSKTESGEVIDNFTFGNTMPAYNITATPNFEINNYTDEFGITYNFSDNQAKIIEYKGDSTNLKLPNTVLGMPVTTICGNVFENSNLVSVALPYYITIISEKAFKNCMNLTNITLSSNLESIGDSAFENCLQLKSITLTKKILNIGNNAFYGCNELNIYANAEEKPIGWNSNWNSSNRPIYWGYLMHYRDRQGVEYLVTNSNVQIIDFSDSCSEVIIPEHIMDINVTHIKEGAFNNCIQLKTVEIPGSVISVEKNAFSNCAGFIIYVHHSSRPNGWDVGWNNTSCSVEWDFKEFYVDNQGVKYYVKNAYATVIDYLGDVKQLTIPLNIQDVPVTKIVKGALNNCTTIESISLPFVGSSVDDIENTHLGYIFGANTYEENATCIPASLKSVAISGASIGDYAFYNCKSLQSVTIGNSVLFIGDKTFENCASLQSVTIGNSVQSIGERAFYNCIYLQSVYITDLEAWCNINFNFSVTDYYPSNPLYYACNLYLNDELITNLEIPNTLTKISDYAFIYCASLQSVTIPVSVQSIGDYAFCGCYNLAEVYNLSSLEITKGSDDNGYVGGYALDVYTSLDTPSKLSTDENGFVIHTDGATKTLVTYVGTASKIEIPNTVTKINNYAFSGYTPLQSVTIGNSVQSIGEHAFYGCYNLAEVYNLSSLEIIKRFSDFGYVGYYALNVYTSLETPSKLSTDANGFVIHTDGETKTLVNYVGSATKIKIPNDIQSIGKGAFYNCTSLQSVTIPDSVQSIGDVAFAGCISLQTVTIPGSVQSIGDGAFGYCVSLQTVTISSGVQYIGYEAFYNCYSLQTVTIPNTVTEINNWAFYNCDSLQTVTILNGVQSISVQAFYDCDSLQTVTIPGSVQSIGNQAFYDCDSLQTVTIPSGVQYIGYEAFYNCYSLQTVTIPSGVQYIGDDAFSHCRGAMINVDEPKRPDTWSSMWIDSENGVFWRY